LTTRLTAGHSQKLAENLHLQAFLVDHREAGAALLDLQQQADKEELGDSVFSAGVGLFSAAFGPSSWLPVLTGGSACRNW